MLITPAAKRNGRGGEIRTLDLLLPKQALYQAKLHPVRSTEGLRIEAGVNAALAGAVSTDFPAPIASI